MKKALLLINNFSGNSRRFSKNEKSIRQRLEGEYEIVRESHIKKGQGVDVDAESKDCDAVIVCGGDGTLNRTINYLKTRLHDTELVYLPTGTSNELGHRLKCDYSLRGEASEYPLTVGFVGDQMFLDAGLAGMFALTGPKTTPELKSKLKRLAFLSHFFSELRNWRIKLKINNSNGISTEGTFSFFMINTCGQALGIKLFKRNQIPKGTYIGIRAPKKKGWLGVITELYNIVCVALKGFSKEYDNKRCVFSHFEEMTLTFDKATEGALDGEKFTFPEGDVKVRAEVGYFKLRYYKK